MRLLFCFMFYILNQIYISNIIGTDRHDYTSFSCMQSVFKFISKQFHFTPKQIKTDSASSPESNTKESEKAGETGVSEEAEKTDLKENVDKSNNVETKVESPMSQDQTQESGDVVAPKVKSEL